MTLGNAIRRLREARGWTQGQLAIKSKVGQSHISQIERGGSRKVSAEVLSKVASVLNVRVDYLCQEAGWLPRTEVLRDPSSAESVLVEMIRSIPTPHIQDRLLEQFTWIAEVARDADLARKPALKLVAESKEEYEEEG